MPDDTRRFSVFTDLALETTELLHREDPREIPGVSVETSESEDITVTRVNILDEIGEQQMGKPVGSYITVEAPGLRTRDWHLQQRVGSVVSDILGSLAAFSKNVASFLVVGLGNRHSAADSLGTRVVEHLLVSRHLRDFLPEDLRGRLRSVSAIAPGVLGITGIETGEIVKGVVDKSGPEAVIAVDALCARSVDRISTTVQIADTGVHPGSGVGNRRPGLTEQSLGVPVIAIGIPTVVRALTIVSDAVGATLEASQNGALSAEQNEALQNLIVTPKEIDTYTEDMARVLATSLNHAFHPTADISEFTRFLG